MNNMTFAPTTLHWMGASFRIVTSRADSGGKIGLFDSTAPVGFGPPRHIHTAEDEVLMVLTGEIEWMLGDASGHAGPVRHCSFRAALNTLGVSSGPSHVATSWQ